MLGIVLFLLLIVVYSYLFGCPQPKVCESQIDNDRVFPEDVFKLLENEPNEKSEIPIYDPWMDDNLGILSTSQKIQEPVKIQPIFLLPPAPQTDKLSLANLLENQKYQKIKSACSLLKKYGFIGKTQKLSGKGATKEKLIKYLQTAIQNQNANTLLAGYLKVS